MAMLSYDAALTIMREQARPMLPQRLALLESLGKVAACDIQSLIQVPSFRNSAMDGFAVCSAMLSAASEQNPVTLPVAAAIAAGDVVSVSDPKSAVQIMTGSAVPEPYDAVVPVEIANFEEGCVTFTKPPRLGDHIRQAGEDVARGDCVLRKGASITPESIMLLASVGIHEVEVLSQPRLHLISTGNEITDEYSAPLSGSQIYNSNTPYLLATAQKFGLHAQYEGIIGDEPVQLGKKLQAIGGSSLIISTGAVSKGAWDFIPETLKKFGATIHFHRVNIRPGKPILFATLPNGSYYFGLPGNPISAAIGFTFFVMPLIRMLQGVKTAAPLTAILTSGFSKKGDFRQFLKASLSVNEQGQLLADIAGGQESFKISPMAANNAWVVLQEGKSRWETGDTVAVLPYGNILSPMQQEEALCQAA